MPQTVRDFMTPEPVTLPGTSSIIDGARLMRDAGIGDVIVLDEDDEVAGIVTDRDIAIRAVAEGRDPLTTQLATVASQDLSTLTPDQPISEAARLMKDRAIRRIPVVENGRAVGVLSLGDLAERLDPESVLGRVSQAPPNE